jgi:8-oxo-dGTP diphosphatase
MDTSFLHRPHDEPRTASPTRPSPTLRNRLTLAIYRRLPAWAQDVAVRVAAPKHSLGVCAVVTDTDGRVLLVRHPYAASERWGLPGGYVEAGEDPSDALVREVREELGVVATVGEPVAVTSHRGRRHVTLYFETAVAGMPVADGVEVAGWRYMPATEVVRLLGEGARMWLPVTGMPRAA